MELVGIPYFLIMLIALAAVFAVREWGAYSGNLAVKYIFTPLVTSVITGFAVLSMIDEGMSAYRVLVLSALVFSIIADTMLMVVEVNLLQQGIVYFMMAHVMYIAAFSLEYEFRGWNAAIAVLLVMLLAMFYRGIRNTVGKLKIPILIYAAVLCTMLFFALSYIGHEITRREMLVISGAILFVVSDFLLAYLSFIRPHKQESVIVWAVYAPAQLLLALSCFS